MTTALRTGLRQVTTRLAPDSTPDGELLSRFLNAQDESAFATLVRRHATMVFGTCRRVLGNASDADDAFQAAFVVLVRKAHSLTDRACVGNYLYGVALHTALKARAMATKRRAKEAKASRERERPESDEVLRVLDEELARLPDKYREPLVMCELEGVSRRAAAERLGIPEGTISSRLATAHRTLERRLKSRGFAAVGIVAALGQPAFAVSDSLTRAAVQAATSGGPAGVTQLAAEVTKMLLFNKLRGSVAVLASVALLLGIGVGVAQRVTAADGRVHFRAPVPVKPAAKKDEELIQGLWQAVAAEGDGQKAPEEALKRIQFRFQGTEVTMPGGRVMAFELDAAAKPKGLLLTPIEGRLKGVKVDSAIYELNGDELKVCIDQRGPSGKDGQAGSRPADFTTAPRDGRASYVFKRVKEEPKKSDADKEYTLKDGEVLKLIPAPFPEGREKIYTKFDAAGGIKPTPPAADQLMAVATRNGVPVSASAFTNRRTPGSEASGKPLGTFLQYALRVDRSMVSDPDGLLDSTIVDADVVLDRGAAPPELVAALRKELKAKCGIDLDLEYREREMEVIAIRGKHTLKAEPPTDPTRPYATAPVVHLFATAKQEHANGTHGDTAHLVGELAQFLGRPVIDSSDLKTNKVLVTTRHHMRYPETAQTRAEDRDVKKVLQNLANQTGLVITLGKQKVRALVVKKASPERKGGGDDKKDEPAWKAEFRKAYGLKDGQLVRRVAPPYPDCRAEYFREVIREVYRRSKLTPDEAAVNKDYGNHFTKFGWKDNWMADGQTSHRVPTKPDEGVPLDYLLDVTLGFAKTRVESDSTTLARKVTGDFVVRVGADPEKAAAELEAILRSECDLPVKFSFRDSEEVVLVLSGKYESKPLEDRKADQVEVYAAHLTDRTTGGGGSGTLKELVEHVERHVSKPVALGRVDGQPKSVSWHYNVRSPMLRDPAKGIDTHAEDTNPATVLENIAKQTGLTVKTEKRKVRTLVVVHGDLKK